MITNVTEAVIENDNTPVTQWIMLLVRKSLLSLAFWVITVIDIKRILFKRSATARFNNTISKSVAFLIFLTMSFISRLFSIMAIEIIV